MQLVDQVRARLTGQMPDRLVSCIKGQDLAQDLAILHTQLLALTHEAIAQSGDRTALKGGKELECFTREVGQESANITKRRLASKMPRTMGSKSHGRGAAGTGGLEPEWLRRLSLSLTGE